MLRNIAVGASAAVIAACLAAAPVAATGLPGAPATVSSGGDPRYPPVCAAPCVTVAPSVADFSAVRRNSPAPPPVATPGPEAPSNPPPDDAGPGGPGPGPGDSAPPAAAPPAEPPTPPAAPDFTPVTAPPPAEPVPTPTSAPAEPREPSEAVLPRAEPRLPQTAADSRPLMVVGGASLIAAGLAWMGGARRRRKRPAVS
jgi:LPXTG-motif cell wall-anchored protein